MMARQASSVPLNRRATFRAPGSIWLMLAMSALVAILIGLAIAIGAWMPATAVVVLAGAVALLFRPRFAVVAVVWGALAVAGTIELYLPGMQAVRWVFAGTSICLLAVAAVHKLAEAPVNNGYDGENISTRAVFALLFLVAISIAVSLLANRIGPIGAVTGAKNYLQMWGLIAAMAWLRFDPARAGAILRILLWVALIQMIFVLHQYFVLVPQRTGIEDAKHYVVAVDIVSGTFGGDVRGGGRSADLAIIAALVITLLFAQWHYGYRRLRSALVLSGIVFAPMLFNEAKLALVVVPLGLLLLLRGRLARRPLQLMVAVVAMVVGTALLVIVYQSLPSAEWQRTRGIDGYLNEITEVNIGDRGYGAAVLNRRTVYTYWWKTHAITGDLRGALFGHGVGVTNINNFRSATMNDPMARYRGYAVGLTGASALLWEIGIFGLAAQVGLFIVAYRLGSRVWRRWRGTVHEPLVRSAQIGILLFSVTLLHNNYITFDIGYQTMFAVLLGYLLAMASAAPDKSNLSGQHQVPSRMPGGH